MCNLYTAVHHIFCLIMYSKYLCSESHYSLIFQGVTFAVFLHASRALTEQKEHTAEHITDS